MRLEAAQMTPPRTEIRPTPIYKSPGVASKGSHEELRDHTLEFSRNDNTSMKDVYTASRHDQQQNIIYIDNDLENEQRREWLARKRSEYSANLLSPNRDTTTDTSHGYLNCDVLTDPDLSMPWKARHVLHQNIMTLKKVFTSYATYGAVEYSNSMNSPNFHRLIQDCLSYEDKSHKVQGSLSRRSVKRFSAYVDYHRDSRYNRHDTIQISPSDIELLFLEYSREDTHDQRKRLLSQSQSVFPVGIETMTERISEAKIGFEDFLNILLRLSSFLEPEENDHVALQRFIRRNMEPLLESDIVKVGFNDLSSVSRLKYILQNANQLKLLGTLYKNIQVYFTFYSSCRDKMDYKGFQSFFKDFSLYPSQVSGNTLRNYFSALVSLEEPGSLYSVKDSASNLKQFQLSIGCHQFVEGIALVLDDIGPKDADSFETRLLIGLKTLDESSGKSKLFSKLSLEYQPEERENFKLLRGLESAYEACLETYIQESKVQISYY